MLLLSSASSVVDEKRTGKVRDKSRQGTEMMEKIDRESGLRLG